MNDVPSFALPGCPWAGHELGIMISCEERLCAWVRQPANTYSNVAFLVVGIYLLILANREKRKTDFHFGLIALFIGAGSAFGHAAQIRFAIFFDYLAQFLLFAYLISFSLHRYRPIRKIWRWSLTAGLVILTSSALILSKKIGMQLFAFMAVGFIALEYLNSKRRPGITYRELYKCVFAFGLAILSFVLDINPAICSPQNHVFQFHALWHVLASLGLLFLARFYSQFSYLIEDAPPD